MPPNYLSFLLVSLLFHQAFSLPSINEKPSSQIADSLYAKADRFFEQTDTIRGFVYLDSALDLYILQQDSLNQSRVLNDHGYYHYYLGNFDQSLSYYRQALTLDRAMSDTIQIIGRLKNIGLVYYAKGLPPLALRYYTEALTLANTIDRPKSIASVSNSIGLLMYEMEQYAKALAYYRTALTAWAALKDTLRMAYAYNNMGQVYHDLGHYDNALVQLSQAEQWKTALNEQRSLLTTLHNLGDTYLAMDSIPQARKRLHASLSLAIAYDNKLEMATVCNSLAKLHLRTQEYPRARHYLDTAKLLIEEVGSRTIRLEHWQLEAQYHEAIGQPYEGLAYQKQWAALQDSLFHEEKLLVVEMQAEYNLQQEEQAREKAEAATALARAETQRQRRLAVIASGSGLLFLGLSLLLFWLYRAYRRTSEQNALLVKEQHHRVKNNLNVIASLLRMHARRLKDKGSKQVMTESQLRIQTMELIHLQLYGEEPSRVNMRTYLPALVQSVLSSYGSSPHLQLEVEDLSLAVDKAVPVGLITNEVVSNACKYAFPRHPHPELRVSFKKTDTNTCELCIHDNGPGLPSEQLPDTSSFGLKLIRLQTDQLRGYHHFDSQQGTLFHLTFKNDFSGQQRKGGRRPEAGKPIRKNETRKTEAGNGRQKDGVGAPQHQPAPSSFVSSKNSKKSYFQPLIHELNHVPLRILSFTHSLIQSFVLWRK